MIGTLFELTSRHKLRFHSLRGELTAEQLWDVPLRSRDGFDLNAVARVASNELKLVSEENFVENSRTIDRERRELKLDVVKHIIAVKLDEETAAAKRADNRLEKEKLLKILAEKQEGKLSKLSEQELQKRIDALE